METAQKTLVSLLVLAVLFFGYLVYKDQNLKMNVNKTSSGQKNTNSNLPSDPKLVRSNKPLYTPTVDVNNLLSENPGAGATTEELKAFSIKVSRHALSTSVVDVTSCSPRPEVARISLKQPIEFKNSDSIPHKLINGKVVIDVPANKSKIITPAFPGPGIFGYSCDTKIVGIFLVVP